MDHLVLVGDSIFDNAPYVQRGESVIELLQQGLGSRATATLVAVDGAVTTDVPKQLQSLREKPSHLFVSAGGNDALRASSILHQPAKSVAEAMGILAGAREVFRVHYRSMLNSTLAHCRHVTVCTIYNSVPTVGRDALTALALFNEIILQEAAGLGLPVIDLRLVCNETADYSTVSPIEPSGQGAGKIAQTIQLAWRDHDFSSKVTALYV